MSDILQHIDAGVMTLTFNRLDKKNSITSDMYAALANGVEQAAADAAVRVVVIQGHETIFSAGNDIGDFLNQPPSGQDSPVFRFLRAIASIEKPVVAAVAGPAVGIGTTLLLHCDLVYVSRDAKLRTPFVNLGLCPEFGSSLLLPQLLGPARAAEVLLLGEPFTGAQAAEWGIAGAALEDGPSTLAKAREMALRFLDLAPSAVADSKRLMRAPGREQLRKVIEEEGALFGQRLRSPEAIEALSAFMQRRKPDFSKFA